MTATMDNSDFAGYDGVQQNTGYDRQEGILTFAEFLDYAENQSVNIFVDIQVPSSCHLPFFHRHMDSIILLNWRL